MIYRIAIQYAIVAALAAAGAWTAQGWRAEASMANLKNDYSKRDFRALENAHADTIRLQETKDAAERVARQRQSALARDFAGTRDALVSLSASADAALRVSGDSLSACANHTAVVTDVFKQCAGRLSEMGQIADNWQNDALMLREAWPK
jgi:hypothetical protein